MTKELKEKMQQAAKKYCAQICNTCGSRKNCNRVDLGRCLPTEDEYTAFLDGAAAMYTELTPLVEWVSVKEQLPKKQGHYLVKVEYSFPKNCKIVVAEFYEDNNTFYSECSDVPIEDVTHWRKIE